MHLFFLKLVSVLRTSKVLVTIKLLVKEDKEGVLVILAECNKSFLDI